MGLLSRVKNRLKIIASDVLGDDNEAAAPRPMATAPTPAPPRPPPPRAPAAPPPSLDDVKSRIAADVKKHPIVIYMKGSRGAPQCGFSAAAVDVFEQLNVPFETRNVLGEPGLREGIKAVTEWPTIPQVFVGGEFIGGTDIVREMHEKGELKAMVEQAIAAAAAT